MDYLKSRKPRFNKASENRYENEYWMKRLLQGKICLDELKRDLCSRIPDKDIEILSDIVLTKRLHYRNRAIGILSLYKGISQETISENLFIPRSTLFRNFKNYQIKGLNHIMPIPMNPAV